MGSKRTHTPLFEKCRGHKPWCCGQPLLGWLCLICKLDTLKNIYWVPHHKWWKWLTINKMITIGNMLWSFLRFSQLYKRDGDQSGEFECWFWGWNSLKDPLPTRDQNSQHLIFLGQSQMPFFNKSPKTWEWSATSCFWHSVYRFTGLSLRFQVAR